MLAEYEKSQFPYSKVILMKITIRKLGQIVKVT